MKALTIQQPYANFILWGYKTIEVRSRPTNYRGEFLVCAGRKKPDIGETTELLLIEKHIQEGETNTLNIYQNTGRAICVARLVDCRPMLVTDINAAMVAWDPAAYAWVLELAYAVLPTRVMGKQGWFNVDDDLITRYKYEPTCI